ncbi:helix-turn-helix domain-containing protein [Streptomyces sp. R-07]|uniref:helix-turn-helix domain-containing protein n=1 Tax=unclassified Streptomyces TaxID=2593676 RepID=UPI003443D644
MAVFFLSLWDEIHRSLCGKLEYYQQALLALAHLRMNVTLPALAAGFVISTATVQRYVDKTLEVLAARASDLRQALEEVTATDSTFTTASISITQRDTFAQCARPTASGLPPASAHAADLNVPAARPAPDIPAYYRNTPYTA